MAALYRVVSVSANIAEPMIELKHIATKTRARAMNRYLGRILYKGRVQPMMI